MGVVSVQLKNFKSKSILIKKRLEITGIIRYTIYSKLLINIMEGCEMAQCGCGNTQNPQGQCDGSHAKGGK